MKAGMWQMGRFAQGAALLAVAGGALLVAGCGAEAEGDDAEDALISTELKDGLGEHLGDPKGAGMCSIEIEGGTCRSDALWQRIAEETCRDRGQTLIAYRAFRGCGAGQFRRVAYACCPAAPPPPPPPPMCEDTALNGACRDLATIKAEAQKTCDSKNLLLTALTPGRACGMGQYLSATVTCCGAKPPPPACYDGTLAGGACQDEAQLKAQAEMTCRGKGATLTAFKADRACGMGKYQAAAYTCCGPNDPPPGPMCFESSLDGAGACKDLMSFSAEAERVCASRMAKLNKLTGDGDCGMGRYQKVRFSCCL